MKIKTSDDLKTKEDCLLFIEAYIAYRGGMFNRINALDIEELLSGKRKVDFKRIMRNWYEEASD